MAYPKPYIPFIPSVVVGTDLETLALRSDAFILTMANVAFDVPTMKMIGSCYQKVDPNDEKAKEVFYIDPKTVGYWEGKDNPDYAPCEEARKEAYSGTTPLPEALWAMKKFLDDLGDVKMVITCRGPEFDHPILMNAFAQCNVHPGKYRKFSILDSDRTIERLAAAFGLEPNWEIEAPNWTHGKEAYEHNANFDAAKEAYSTARLYHLALVARTYGFERMLDAHREMCTGEYIAPQLRGE
ncbi:putative endodeoxyribonuclease [Salmonella phage SPAsTU]|nr:putative endodeoxyribonuclease [Salmonella phage STsAS]AWN09141.1 putative endodeoxyribonuclease [Salmonella phage SPAsTU]